MRINFNIIKGNLRKEQISEFKKLIRQDIEIKEFTIFQKIISSWITLFLLGVLEIVGIILLIQGFSSVSRQITWTTLALLIFPAVMIVFIFGSRKKIISNATKNLDFLEIFKKWLKYYEISPENVFIDNQNFQKEINENRLSPIDANINKASPLYTFVDENNIVTSFKVIKWHWVTVIVDSKGNTIRKDNYLDQIYMFNYNFNDKWDKLDFKLSNDNRLLKIKKISKNETLENDAFNRKFSYSYNDPIKLRMAFTPYTQEILVNKYLYTNITLQKKNKILTTTCDNRKISQDFSPFSYDVSSLDMNEEKIKDRIIEDLTTDFMYLMKFVGHAHLIVNLFK